MRLEEVLEVQRYVGLAGDHVSVPDERAEREAAEARERQEGAISSDMSS